MQKQPQTSTERGRAFFRARGLRILLLAVAAVAGASALAGGALGQGESGVARSIELSGTIDPATADWITSALDEAAEDGVELAIIRIDTPGGLDTSTREMVKEITGSPLPVVAYVSPDGGRAASAGVFITEASDVAAMAPQTNIGSATPISIGPGGDNEVLGEKIENDAAAYARALAEGHGRNGELAARTVTEAENVTAEEARTAHLIDLIATSEQELLEQLEGFHVQGPKAQTLETAGLRIEREDMPLRYELLQLIVNPTIAFLLLTVGVIGIALELLSPGLVIPGAFGLVSLVLGLYGTAQVPVRISGVLLLLLAMALIVAEAHLATGGALGIAGVAALVASGLLLYDTDSEAFGASPPVVVATAVLVGGLLAFATQRVVAAHRVEPVRTGWEEMVGAEGDVRLPLEPVGQVFVEGALWRARGAEEGTRIGVGNRVRVQSVEGLTLVVRPVSANSPEKGEKGN
jgi:membrane-bound serine protease (ClpP class)